MLMTTAQKDTCSICCLSSIIYLDYWNIFRLLEATFVSGSKLKKYHCIKSDSYQEELT